jgi:uroporphyrinogen decarboxylase
MTGRERVRKALGHEEPDRVPVYDSLWNGTILRWHQEGLPSDVDPEDYFDYDIKVFLPDISMQYPYEVIKEDGDSIIERTRYGELIKNYKSRSSTPQIIESPIKSRKDWEAQKERLQSLEGRGISTGFSALIFDKTISLEEGLKKFISYSRKNKFVMYGAICGFDLLQRYVGMERLLFSILDDPEWVRDMLAVNTSLIIDMFTLMTKTGYSFDGIFLYDDLGYKNASLISPKHYEELFMDSDSVLCDFFHAKGMKVVLHCDGCVKELIPYFIRAGFDCLQPLEVKAGMNLLELKETYGKKLAFMGGIDVRLYSLSDPNLIENEIRDKFAIAKKNGGYIYHSDHSVPHDVSFLQYKRILSIVGKYGGY